jgi:serine/threonine protein kinase
MHYKCRNQNVIPFYGIAKAPEGNGYAMVIKLAKYGDLRNYIRKFFKTLTWVDRVKILIEISKALNSLHQMSLVHKDFHCKNILVDKDNKIFISDFGLCQPIDSKIGKKIFFFFCFILSPLQLTNYFIYFFHLLKSFE